MGLVIPVEGTTDQFVIAHNREIRKLEWAAGKSTEYKFLETLCRADDHKPTNRFNDGKCDSRGRLWAGTMGEEKKETPGKVEDKAGNVYKIKKASNNQWESDLQVSSCKITLLLLFFFTKTFGIL